MVHLVASTTKLIRINSQFINSMRYLSKYLHKDISSKVIRQKFLDYFINENNHKFIKSSPVVPYCDPTVAFVNAGMNQFKGIFLGTQTPPSKRVANSQKCVRVGGKHNDLNVVGTDGYHHTFFEMLGSWSFGDYFKTEACKMAWELLTQVYRIPKSRLYVTYFAGDKSLGLEEDMETKEIWKALGLPSKRIVPFGMKDNFWEMGLLGPCGPCTEIHYNHGGSRNRAEFINKGLHDLTEIWNIVFIEYNRLSNGDINLLPKKHVDTGMGFERLTSIMQGKFSNYDTDNFDYLLKAIHKVCSDLPKYTGKYGESDWNHLDKSYRVLADHIRMITVCLADGMIPEENQKLRRILRKTFLLGESIFKKEKGLVKELTNYVVENLGPIYPELEKNIRQVHQIINYEEEVYKAVRQAASKDWQILVKETPKLLELDITETPSFIAALKELKPLKLNEIDSKLAFKLYDSFGLDEDGISKLSSILNLNFEPQKLSEELELARLRSKKGTVNHDNKTFLDLAHENHPKTDNKSRYAYLKAGGKYTFAETEARLLKIFEKGISVDEIESDCQCSLLLDKTSLYSEAGGQISDRGIIKFQTGKFEVTSLENVNGYILHKGIFKSDNTPLRIHDSGVVRVDEVFRMSCMRNHTSTHILNAVLKQLKGATCQKSSKVSNKYFSFDVAIFGDKLDSEDVVGIEEAVLEVLRSSCPVHIREVDSQTLLGYDNVTLIPGEVYPDIGIRIIEIKNNAFLSREPCCGTHVLNTSDIEDFCIINTKSLGRSTVSISAVTGDRATLARQNGARLLEEINTLKIYAAENSDKPEVIETTLNGLKKKLIYNVEDDVILPITVKLECTTQLQEISRHNEDIVKENLRDFIEIEMKTALNSNIKCTKSNQKYVLHYLRTSALENIQLQKATRLCPDLPILVVSYSDNMVKARCCVPENLKTDKFDAEKWMKASLADVFRSKAAPPKGQDGSLVCNMKAKRVNNLHECDILVNNSLEKAQQFIDQNL